MTLALGIDLSLARCGFAFYDDIPTQPLRCHSWQPPGNGPARISAIQLYIAGLLANVDLAVIEGPAFGSKGRSQHELGGAWHGAVTLMWERGVAYAVVPPANLKQYATGKGNASKDLVYGAVLRRWEKHCSVQIETNDEADAITLACVAAHRLGEPVTPPTAYQDKALAAVNWPVLVSDEA